MMKQMMLIALLAMNFTVFAAEGTKIPILQKLENVAPHLPSVTRSDGTGEKFHAEKYAYTAESMAGLKTWAATYPQEAEKFKAEATAYVQNTNVSDLPAHEAEVYYDIKARWLYVIQLLNQ